jgi:putative ABC transport system permease protein
LNVILWKVALRHYTHHPWQILLSVIGIALGVAVVVAIDLTNSSASKAFDLSAEAVSGSATHEVVGGPDGLPEDFYVQLRLEDGVENIAPVVEGYAQLTSLVGNKQKTMQILGVDVFAEAQFRDHLENTTQPFDITRFLATPNTAVMLQSTAREYGLRLDSDFELLVRGVSYPFTLVGMIKDTGEPAQQALQTVIFVDIATAQEVLGLHGQLSRIDVKVPDTEKGEALLQTIRAQMPETATVVPSEERSYAMEQMTDAFQANLTALSLLALLVGVFLIYNTMTFAIVQRRDILGYMRTLGVTKREIFKLVLIEAAIIGLISTVLGLFAGVLLGQSLLHLVTRTINDLYFVITVSDLHVSFWSIVKGILIGVVATMVAAFIPAREATHSSARASSSRSILELKYKYLVFRVSWVGYALLALGVTVLLIPTQSLFVSFAGLFIVIMGFALLVPLLTIGLVKVFAPVLRTMFGELGNMAARGVTASFSRTAVAVTSLTIAVATTIGVTVMIDSFRLSVVDWLDNTLRADVFVSVAGVESASDKGGLSPVWVERFRSLRQVDSVSIGRRVEFYTNGQTSELFAIQMPRKAFTRFRLIEGELGEVRQKFYDEGAVLISEPYAFRHDLHKGDSLTLPTNKGKRDFEVAGVYVDYGSEQGVITINRGTYLKHWHDNSVSSLGVYASHDADVDELIAKMRELVDEQLSNPYTQIKEQDLEIRSNAAIREASIRIFDRTFAVTQVLRLLAIIVAFVGILSALMAIQIERSRELGLMRAIGLTPRQVWMVVSGETGIIGALAGFLAMPIGIVLALILILVINRRSFGWSMDVSIDPLLLSQSLTLAIIAALLAGIYPALRMARISPGEALREE